MIFNDGYNDNSIDKCYFQKHKKTPINVNEVDINKIFLSIKTPYGEQKSYNCYTGYLGGTGFRPLHIIIKKRIIY